MLQTRRQDSHQQLAAPYLQHDTLFSAYSPGRFYPLGIWQKPLCSHRARCAFTKGYPNTPLHSASEHNSNPNLAGAAYRRDCRSLPLDSLSLGWEMTRVTSSGAFSRISKAAWWLTPSKLVLFMDMRRCPAQKGWFRYSLTPTFLPISDNVEYRSDNAWIKNY